MHKVKTGNANDAKPNIVIKKKHAEATFPLWNILEKLSVNLIMHPKAIGQRAAPGLS